MKGNRSLFWHQGLFLQPQHFQLQELHVQSLLAPYQQYLNPHFWGVAHLAFDESGLESGSLGILEGEFMFPDGSHVMYPGNSVLLSRSFEDAWDDGKKTFRAFLGLRKWDPNGDNVRMLPSLQEISSVMTRYVTTENSEEAPDLYQDGPSAQVKHLHYNLRIFWETEKDELTNYHAIPLVQLERQGDHIRITREFIPPLLIVEASETLLGLLRDTLHHLSVRIRQLEDYKSPFGLQTSAPDVGSFNFMIGIHVLSRYVAWLNQLVNTRKVHPWNIFKELVQLCGELTNFSPTISATGEDENRNQVIPAYNHKDLYGCFASIQELIDRLIREISFGPEAIIRLEPQEDILVGALENRLFADSFNYYLVLRSKQQTQFILDSINAIVKFSAKENLPILQSRALPGIQLAHIPAPPPGIPQTSRSTVFLVDTASIQWKDIQRYGNAGLLWDGAPDDLIAELVILRRY